VFLRGFIKLKNKMQRKIYLLLLLVLVVSCFHKKPNPPTVETRNASAIVIGISSYQNLQPLDFSYNDAKDIRDKMINYVGISEDKITFLTNQSATKSAIANAFKSAKNLTSSEFLIVYYSGHGGYGIDTNGDEKDSYDEYLLPFDTKKGDMSSAISDDTLSQWMKAIPTKVLFIIDGCYSGGIQRVRFGKPKFSDFMDLQITPLNLIPPANDTTVIDTFDIGIDIGLFVDSLKAKAGTVGNLTSAVEDQSPISNRIYLTASMSNELSWELNELKHGLFTYFILQALEINGATAESIFDYASQNIAKYIEDNRLSFSQIPVIVNREEARKLNLVKYSQ
jgi:uncharacterized caspase-like protein